MSTSPLWQVEASSTFTAALVMPAGLVNDLGARIEVPVTRAIVGAWTVATLDTDGVTAIVTLEAPPDPGAYNVVWRTDDPHDPPQYEAFIPLIVTAAGVALTDADYPEVDEDAVRPDTSEVAELIRTRTVDQGGEEQGDFTDQTRPTTDEAEGLIDTALDDVLAGLKRYFDPAHYAQVRRAVALQAAVLIEASFYREQANDQAVQLLNARLASALSAVAARIEEDYARQLADEITQGAVLA